MKDSALRHLWLISSLFILLVAAGCWVPGSSGALLTPVPQNLPTLTPVPSETPIPTITDSPEPTIDLEALLATEEIVPSETATLEGITQVAQILPTDPDVLIQGATDFVATITQEVIDQTRTAEFEIFVPTETPTPEFFETPTFTPAPLIAGNDCVHEVRTGDNLFRISLTYGVPIRDIANRSGVANINMIVVGQKLTIPGCGTTGAIPPATSIPLDTSGNTTFDGSTTTTTDTTFTSTGGVQHIVEQGETLFQISLQYNVPVRAIADRNGISNINLIYIEQTLTIP
ncbi:MAG: LysM peptidoglycan-binding domain-containing protein [Anaerolineae bacterium]|nr:LysM peptidoglycan-binding domain-containing protein [Anaerolineae bacterium]